MEWDIQRAARNALRLHAASLPALACALLLLRLAVLTCLTTCLSSRLTSHLFPVSNSASHHADRHPLQPQAHSKHCTPAFKSNLKVPRGALYYAMFMWAATASWLWPQLAIAAGWMSHRRPSLPSVTWSCFLLLLAEGLLEAFERVADLVAWCGKQLPCVQGGSVPGALVHMKIRDTPSWLRCVYALLIVGQNCSRATTPNFHQLCCTPEVGCCTSEPSGIVQYHVPLSLGSYSGPSFCATQP